jgi:hypothetical protein
MHLEERGHGEGGSTNVKSVSGSELRDESEDDDGQSDRSRLLVRLGVCESCNQYHGEYAELERNGTGRDLLFGLGHPGIRDEASFFYQLSNLHLIRQSNNQRDEQVGLGMHAWLFELALRFACFDSPNFDSVLVLWKQTSNNANHVESCKQQV